MPNRSVAVVGLNPRRYSPPMSDKLATILERLKAHQRDLILPMADHEGMPAGSALRQWLNWRTPSPPSRQ